MYIWIIKGSIVLAYLGNISYTQCCKFSRLYESAFGSQLYQCQSLIVKQEVKQNTNKKQTSQEMFCLFFTELLFCFLHRLFDENLLNRRTLASKAL